MCGFAECLEFEDPENFDSKEEFIGELLMKIQNKFQTDLISLKKIL